MIAYSAWTGFATLSAFLPFPVFPISPAADAIGILNDDWRDVIGLLSVLGVGMTFVGVVFAIVQIRRTRTSAEAAKDAATAAGRQVSEKLLVSELSSSIRRISEIRAFLDANQYPQVGLRLSDLREVLVQIAATASSRYGQRGQFQTAISQVSSLERELITRQDRPEQPSGAVQVHERLMEISDFLTRLHTEIRLQSGGPDANS